ncbi:hypothetical protein [Azospirillum brasilense]|uniref:hypothetical protein n=1 Tax=Azospirillum brasilense TaxID=192 RepID=UPI0005500466|nr:hypothetical protein [Azospirillum brasilense]
MQSRWISSKVMMRSPATPLARVSRSTASLGADTATSAVAVARGSGDSFSTAAVTMPSVPSDPMKICFMS